MAVSLLELSVLAAPRPLPEAQWAESTPEAAAWCECWGASFTRMVSRADFYRRSASRAESFLHEGETVSGVLADGTPFMFSYDDGDRFFGPSSSQTNLRVLELEVAPVAAATPGVFLASTSPDLVGIRDGQTLRVDSGSVVTPNFVAGRGSSVIVEAGGTVGDNFEAVGSNVLIQGGQIGQNFDVFAGAQVEFHSGTIGSGAQVHEGRLAISGGVVGDAADGLVGGRGGGFRGGNWRSTAGPLDRC